MKDVIIEISNKMSFVVLEIISAATDGVDALKSET